MADEEAKNEEAEAEAPEAAEAPEEAEAETATATAEKSYGETVTQIVDLFTGLTVMEVLELQDALKDKGIEPAAAAAVVAGPAGGGDAAAEEKSTFDVVLKGAGAKKEKSLIFKFVQPLVHRCRWGKWSLFYIATTYWLKTTRTPRTLNGN